MKSKLIPLVILALGNIAANGVVIYSDDFDTNVGGAATSSGMTSNIIDSTTVPALGAGRGNVAEIDISTGGQWGSFDVPGGAIDLPVTTVAGVDSYTLKMDVFLPTTTTAAAGDSISVIMRLNGTTPDFFAGGFVRNSAFLTNAANQGAWFTIERDIVIPEFNNLAGGASGAPVTSLLPIFSIRDFDNDTSTQAHDEGDPGVFAYIDNLSFEVTESIPEPSSALLGMLGALALLRRHR